MTFVKRRDMKRGEGRSTLGRVWWWASLVVVVALFVSILMLSLGMVYQRIAAFRDAAAYPPPGQLHRVEGGRLHIYCKGEGGQTVVMDSAIGAWSIFWMDIQAELSKSFRACVYDRAGYGWSEPSRRPRTGENIVGELHLLLRRAGVEEPVLLVAHSFAGLTARIHAYQYPDEVSGLVLIDSLHEDFVPVFDRVLSHNMDDLYPLLILASRFGILRMLADELSADPGLRGELAATYRTQVSVPTYYETVLEEKSYMLETAARARQAGYLGDIPLVVVSARRLYASGGLLPQGLRLGELNARWGELQVALGRLSTSSLHLLSRRAGTNVLLRDPKLVTAGVALAAWMVEEGGSGGSR